MSGDTRRPPAGNTEPLIGDRIPDGHTIEDDTWRGRHYADAVPGSYVAMARFEYPRRWPKVLAIVAILVALVALGVWLLP